MSGRSKNHTVKGGTSPYKLSMGVPQRGLCDNGSYFEKNNSRFRYQIMLGCWEEDPNKRPDFEALVEKTERMLADLEVSPGIKVRILKLLLSPVIYEWTSRVIFTSIL